MEIISQYLRHSALAEAHRASAFNWGRMNRAIATELSLPPEERTSPSIHFLRDQQAVFDQNIENSPPILGSVISDFRLRFCNENAKSFFATADKEVEIVKEALKDKLEFVQNAQGDVEEFDQSDYKEKYLKYIDEQYNRFKQETLVNLKTNKNK